ncbi:MAG: hypothetical protein ACRD5J_17685 [Nitrososphaeraceae archaeon]
MSIRRLTAKCPPVQGKECPEGFGTTEDGQYFPEHYEGCPEGYHSIEDDETGQRYPNSSLIQKIIRNSMSTQDSKS